VEADDEHRDEAGVFFNGPNGQRYPAKAIAVNEPHLLKVLVPQSLTTGYTYFVEVITQSSARNSGTLLKELRTVTSDIELTAQ
jgi:hypothetical protein